MLTALAATVLLAAMIVGGPLPAVAWGAVVTAAFITRVPYVLSARPRLAATIWLYVLSYVLWLASDLARAFADPRPAGTALPLAEATAAAGTLTFCIVIVSAVYMRGRPRIETWLDGGIFLAALAPAIWLLVLRPDASPFTAWSALWTLSTLLILFAGSLFLISGGIWNAPSIALVGGVVGSLALDVALRIPDLTAPSSAAHFLPAAVAAVFVARHPDLDRVFERGGLPAGIPLDARVWMLAATLTLPLGTLGWSYVQGDGTPIALIAASVALIALIVAIRAVLLMRRGVENWSVPLTISLTALLVSGVAVVMSVLGQSAVRAQDEVRAAAARLPEVRRLDGLLLRATGPSSEANAALVAWAATVNELRRGEPSGRAALDAYVTAAATATAAAADGDIPRTLALLDGPVAQAQDALVLDAERDLTRKTAAMEAREQRVRTFSVSMLAVTLLFVTGLLLRFTAARRRVDLLHQATHDELTGLSNRAALDRELARTLKEDAPEHARTLAILDLDHFKAINDAQGRRAGDAVITAVARRLEESIRSDHMVIRLDGDAFAVLTPPGADGLVAAQRMLATLTTPIQLASGPQMIHGSVGVADVDESDGDRATSALRNAELAMYQAKLVAGNSVERFSADMDERVRSRIALLADLRAALDGEEGLHLAYQPIVDLSQGEIRGYEALIRWNHPTRGPLSPAQFVPLAEEHGLIVDLGGWVLRAATAQLAAWQQEWQDARYVSVNVAAAQFITGALVEQVQTALDHSGLEPHHLLLEVTESTLIEDIDANLAQLERVRDLGVRVALDDFGTGYSSLSYLRRFPVDVVKVDKAFIDALGDDDGSLLVRAIVDMATSLRLRVVAEGIEEAEQAAILQQFGCQLGQGYHFSRPVPPLEIQAAPGRFDVPKSSQLRALP